LHEATNVSNDCAFSHNALKSSISSPVMRHRYNTFTDPEVPRKAVILSTTLRS
jgi:hypothetical protein